VWHLFYPDTVPNLKSLGAAVAQILKGNPQILGSSPIPGQHRLFFWWDLMMGLGKLQLRAKFEVTDFICYGDIRKFVLK